jgi:hypothetical protein
MLLVWIVALEACAEVMNVEALAQVLCVASAG